MIILAIALTAALVFFILVYALFQLYFQKEQVVKSRLKDMRVKDGDTRTADMYWQQQMNRSLSERLLQPLTDKVAKTVAQFTPTSMRKKAEEMVEASGGFEKAGLNGFLMLLGGSVVIFLLLGISYVATHPVPFGRKIVLMLLCFAGGVGFPFFVLSRVVAERQEKIRSSMPDVLDLLCVSVQAGLGLDGAMGKVTAKMKGPLIDEFERLLQELRMGVTRRHALQRLAKRCGIQEMQLFTAALIQAERLGVGMAQVLEIQSENMREMRRQRAKESAAKLPVKILIPTIIFIFPVMFVVVLGPAIASILESVGK